VNVTRPPKNNNPSSTDRNIFLLESLIPDWEIIIRIDTTMNATEVRNITWVKYPNAPCRYRAIMPYAPRIIAEASIAQKPELFFLFIYYLELRA
jgi:hypothetical protein